jgi:hypothetical protein
MSTQTCIRPVKSAVFSFLGVTIIVLAFALAGKKGFIEPDVVKRAIGLATGVMIMVIGNLLPKLRPLSRTRTRASSTPAERLSGWLFVLTGIAWIALFALAPLNQARHVSAIIGTGTLVMIAVSWAWLAQKALFGSRKETEETPALDKRAAERRKLVGYLLFAFVFVIVTACVKFLIDEKQLADAVASWMLFAFNMVYAILFAFLEYGHARKFRGCP